MLKRKIEQKLIEWKNTPNKKPLVIKGLRQCGKTYSVRKFAKENYRHEVYLNFFENPLYKTIFSGSLEVDHLMMMISAILGDKAQFVPGETLVVLDEIQFCPEARTSLKFFKTDGRFDVIATGSLLGLEGYREGVTSVPVGYESAITMFPLDFEEFLWANGITAELIDMIKTAMKDETPVPEALHLRMKELLLEYAVVGGMPDVVEVFRARHQMNEVLEVQRSLIASYRDDMAKYASQHDKPLILSCFDSIPRQLGKENKKFQYSLVKKGSTATKFAGCIQWIVDAGIGVQCFNVDIPELPLDGVAIDSQFKLYIQDMGLFVSMLEDGTQADILQGKLTGYKGAIFENLAADFFVKMGRKKLYYYHKDSGLEVDFVMRYKGRCTLIEAKAKTGDTKSTKTILNHPEKYTDVGGAIKLGDYNIGRNGKILTLPLYTGFLLDEP